MRPPRMSTETFRCGDAERPSARAAARMRTPGPGVGAAVAGAVALGGADGVGGAGLAADGASRHAVVASAAALRARKRRRVSALMRPYPSDGPRCAAHVDPPEDGNRGCARWYPRPRLPDPSLARSD